MANKLQKSIIKIDKDLLRTIQDNLIKNGGLKITGFGMFTLIKTKGVKNGINPYTQKRQNFPSYVKVHFKPVKQLKTNIQKWKK